MGIFFETKNLCFSYLKKPLCLKDVSFSAEKNDKVMILGAKDSGKTTLIKSLSGFDDKYFGSVKLAGKEMKTISDAEKNVSLILDYPTLIAGSIDKNLNFLFESLNLALPTKEEKQELLIKFNLDFPLKTNVKKLSCFEKFKLCFLRTYIKSPKIIFIDDFFKNEFNAEEQKQLIETLNFVCKDKLVFWCFGQNTFKNCKFVFDKFNFSKFFYLNLAKLHQFNCISNFLNNPVDLDACYFNDNFKQKEAYCLKQDGAFYLCFEENYFLKIDKKFDAEFEKLKLADNENEDVVMVFDKELKIDLTKDNEFNKLLENKKVHIFSKIDRSRVI